MKFSHRSLPNQAPGSVSAYEREGAVHNGRTLNADLQPVAGGQRWVGDMTCRGTRKDGHPCSARSVGNEEFCIGHLRGSKEEG